MYDFREGLLLDQSIYKDNTCDWKAAFLYILSMLVCYAWGLGWWYLFYYLYGTYEKIVFWIWIAIFIIHFIIMITIGVSNLQSGKRRKEQRRKEEQEKLEQEKRIQNSRKRKIDSEQPLKVNNDANSGRVNTEMQALK